MVFHAQLTKLSASSGTFLSVQPVCENVNRVCISRMAPSENLANTEDNVEHEDNDRPVSNDKPVDDNLKAKKRCVGRCDMELGDVTHHNVQVACLIQSFHIFYQCESVIALNMSDSELFSAAETSQPSGFSSGLQR